MLALVGDGDLRPAARRPCPASGSRAAAARMAARARSASREAALRSPPPWAPRGLLVEQPQAHEAELLHLANRGGWSSCRRRSGRGGRRSSSSSAARQLLGLVLRSCCSSRAVNQNVEPTPTSLSHADGPAHQLGELREMIRPRPVPPYLRVVEESTCVKEWNRRSRRLGRDADAGVATSKRTDARPILVRPPGSRPVSTISPSSVNFTALLSRLRSTWRRRPGSPRTRRGTFGAMKVSGQLQAPCASWRGRAGRSSPRRARAQSRSRAVSSSSLPASILEKSRMSLMIRSSDSADSH